MSKEKDTKQSEPNSPPRTTNPNTTGEVRGNVIEPRPVDTPRGINKEQPREKPKE